MNTRILTLSVLSLFLFCCQKATIKELRSLQGRLASEATSGNVSVGMNGFSLAAIPAENLVGEIVFGGNAEAVAGSQLQIAVENINLGIAGQYHLKSFSLETTNFDIAPNQGDLSWEKGTQVLYSSEDGTRRITAQIANQFTINSYDAAFYLVETQQGSRTARQIETTLPGSGQANTYLKEAPSFSLIDAYVKAGVASFNLRCDVDFDEANKTCDGKDLNTDLLVMVGSLTDSSLASTLNDYELALRSYLYADYFGSFAEDSQFNEGHYLDAAGEELFTAQKTTAEISSIGINVSVNLLENQSILSVYLQWYERTSDIPFTSVLELQATEL